MKVHPFSHLANHLSQLNLVLSVISLGHITGLSSWHLAVFDLHTSCASRVSGFVAASVKDTSLKRRDNRSEFLLWLRFMLLSAELEHAGEQLLVLPIKLAIIDESNYRQQDFLADLGINHSASVKKQVREER